MDPGMHIPPQTLATLQAYFDRTGTPVAGSLLVNGTVTPAKLSFSPATAGDIADLQGQINSLTGSTGGSISVLQAQVSGLQSQVSGLQSQVSGLESSLALAESRILALETLLSTGHTGVVDLSLATELEFDSGILTVVTP
jgi:prophage DNA circulation protein